jgi:xanthine dehydrogenase accessory factor
MDELSAILEALSGRDFERAVLATLVSVEGSSYRRPGAKLLVTDRGRVVGTISGGCIETTIRKHLADSIDDVLPHLFAIDTTGRGDELYGSGTGCLGRLQLLVEPFAAASVPHCFGWLESQRRARRRVEVALVFRSEHPAVPPGTRLLDRADIPVGVGAVMQEALAAAMRERNRAVRTAAGTIDLFHESLEPPVRLLLFGAGDDAIPLVAIASTLGWECHVHDRRTSLLDAGRFPSPARLIAGDAAESVAALEPDSRTAVVVMTHNFYDDLELLRRLVPQRWPYIGLVGSRKRFGELIDVLACDGASGAAGTIYGPAGLDLASASPPEIALSIIAEACAVLGGRSARSLRHLPASPGRQAREASRRLIDEGWE